MKKVFESNTLDSHQAIKPLIDACRCIRVNRTPLKRAGNECWSSPSVQYVSPCCPSFPTHISVVHQHHHLDGEAPLEATYRTHQEGLKQSDLMSVFRLCLDMWVCGCVCPRVVPLSCVRFQSCYPSTVSTADGAGVCVCVSGWKRSRYYVIAIRKHDARQRSWPAGTVHHAAEGKMSVAAKRTTKNSNHTSPECETVAFAIK